MGEIWVAQDCGPISRYLYCLDFVNQNVGWAAGSDGALCKTTDGGETWINKNLGGRDFYDIDFIDENKGWAIGRGDGVSMTTDGGETWDYRWFDFIRTDQYFNKVYFADENHGWAVGKYGVIVHSNDGGNNWYLQADGVVESTDFQSVYFIDDTTGWIVGSDGTILKTTNGGSLQSGIVEEQVARPVFTPRIGYFPPSFNVNLTSATAGAIIRYTLDGTEPTLSSPIYNTPITLDETSNVVLKAKAWKDPLEPSKDIAGLYTYAHDIEVSLPTLSEVAGDTVLIPIEVGDVTGMYIVGYEFKINFNSSVIRPMHPELLGQNYDTRGTLSAEKRWTVWNFTYENSIRVWASGGPGIPLRGSGVLW